MVRVLRVITRLNIGGPSKQILTLNSLFDGIEFEQIIITGKVLDSEKEIDLKPLGDVIRIDSLERDFDPVNELQSILQISRIIRQYRPDLIHTHLSKAWALTILARILSGVNCKVIHTFHGHILHSYFSERKISVLNSVQKFLASKSDYLVAVNEITKKELIAAQIGSESKFTVIKPGFKTLNQKSKVNARKSLGLIDHVFTVGYVGRFEAIKRPDILSEVINISVKNLENIQFVVCGGGDLYDGFKRETMSPKVHCFSWTDDLSLIYSSVDLMILTSDNEGSPLSIIEAGQLGVPTLSRAVGGVPSLISHNSNGFLTGDNPEMIASALSHIFRSADLLSDVSAKTKAFFEHDFGEFRFLTNYKNLYIKANSN